MFTYNDDDIIITDIYEIMTYADSKKYQALVYRMATEKEAEQYRKKCEHLKKYFEQKQHEK